MRNHRGRLGSLTYPRRHVTNSHEPEGPTREGEHIAGTEPSDEVLLDGADGLSPNEFHLHGGLTHDGADRHPVPHGRHTIADHVKTIALDDLVVLGIGAECLPATSDEVEHPPPLPIG